MSLLVRLATVTDAAGIAAVHVASWRAAYAGLIPQDYLDSLSVQERTRSWDERLGQPSVADGTTTLVAELEGAIIGFASVGPSRDDDALPGTKQLWALYVHPDQWGARHGHALHSQALAQMRATGSTPSAEATLWVLASNQRARRFYEQHGWRGDGAQQTEWRGDVRLDEVRYRLALAGGPHA